MDTLSVEVTRYKAFEAKQRLEVCPLTILIGNNNAGKSAIARVPVLISESLSNHKGLLQLQARSLDFGQSGQDLCFDGTTTDSVDFAVEVQIEKRPYRLEIVLEWFRSHLNVVPERLILKRWCLTDLADTSVLGTINFDYEQGRHSLSFAGVEDFSGDVESLLPVSHIPELLSSNRALRPILALLSYSGSVGHLGPFRSVPPRVATFIEEPPPLSGDGSQAACILAKSRATNDNLVHDVSSWFEVNFGQALSLEIAAGPDQSRNFRFGLSQRTGMSIPLSYCGAGIAQILPLVVFRFQATHRLWSQKLPRLQIIEQPELHLHPAAHGAVGDLLVDIVSNSQHRLVVETHSENLILRVRRRIAEGRLAPERVALYWVEREGAASSLKRLEIDSDGSIPNWPGGVFAEDAEEARALARAMRSIESDS